LRLCAIYNISTVLPLKKEEKEKEKEREREGYELNEIHMNGLGGVIEE
jgi:hypothetical protein